jgi:hypothetical protein
LLQIIEIDLSHGAQSMLRGGADIPLAG